MNGKQILLGIVLFDFLALTGWAVYEHGYVGFFDLMIANSATITAFADLTIALALILVWMWQDARERGIAVLPYVVVTLLLGSAGPLAYLIVRFSTARVPAPRLATQPR